ncbi:MAG: GT4 family glycosyltransferase PelF [Solobacterium sp.]|nr:GT4 family glycosyltransferase PelF [Solobacterium sp.]
MRVCIVVEGCYPYVVGGVSSWVHSMIRSFPNIDFVILAIISGRDMSGKFVYELPENVSQVYEVYLSDDDWRVQKRNARGKRLKKDDYQALRSLIRNRDLEWNRVFDIFRRKDVSVDRILMGEDFLRIVKEVYDAEYPQIVFSDFLWTMRSIYLPLFLVLKTKIPKADLYHCVCTGYAGVLGSMATHFHNSRLMISEHGIYTREREEELIRAKWVMGIYKNIWIEQFRKMSNLAYMRADIVTSLFEHARELQIEIGCPEEKTVVTPNGVNTERLQNLPGKTKEDEGLINIGAVLRVTAIKDVKTMIQAFHYAFQKDNRLRLYLMGPTNEEPEYAAECQDMCEYLGIQDVVIFTGRIDIRDYLGRMDMTILTSISEGQPLTILEGFAAHLPAIATDVGNCSGLIYGEHDNYGPAGIVAHVMNTEEISDAMLELARDPEKRKAYGEAGYQRVLHGYRIEDMKKKYEELYRYFADEFGFQWEGGE